MEITHTRQLPSHAEDGMPDAPTYPASATLDRSPRKEAPRLEVYVSSECMNCEEAVRLAEEAAARFPTASVRVIDLDMRGSPPPDPVVAVPTYVLNGRVVSLGNPDSEELFARVRESVE
jgi:alkyl hydroperoxide reductase subunit AhpF